LLTTRSGRIGQRRCDCLDIRFLSDPQRYEQRGGRLQESRPFETAADYGLAAHVPHQLAYAREGPERPVELRERIGGISSKVLTETLRRLQFNGLVDRHAHPGAPPRVEYRLTALGETLLAPIDAVGAWAFEHGDEVMAAQEAERTPTTQRPPHTR
jgi:DNA-binding HxlR family transcriptional regulator